MTDIFVHYWHQNFLTFRNIFNIKTRWDNKTLSIIKFQQIVEGLQAEVSQVITGKMFNRLLKTDIPSKNDAKHGIGLFRGRLTRWHFWQLRNLHGFSKPFKEGPVSSIPLPLSQCVGMQVWDIRSCAHRNLQLTTALFGDMFDVENYWICIHLVFFSNIDFKIQWQAYKVKKNATW